MISISQTRHRQERPVPAPSDIRRKRLLFRSWHRGTRESDLILGRFAEAHLAGFDDRQLDCYEALLDCDDADLFDWVSGRSLPPARQDHDVMRLLLAFRTARPA
jgi:antitoxin CptB